MQAPGQVPAPAPAPPQKIERGIVWRFLHAQVVREASRLAGLALLAAALVVCGGEASALWRQDRTIGRQYRALAEAETARQAANESDRRQKEAEFKRQGEEKRLASLHDAKVLDQIAGAREQLRNDRDALRSEREENLKEQLRIETQKRTELEQQIAADRRAQTDKDSKPSASDTPVPQSQPFAVGDVVKNPTYLVLWKGTIVETNGNSYQIRMDYVANITGHSRYVEGQTYPFVLGEFSGVGNNGSGESILSIYGKLRNALRF